ncbi:hypothetical protein MKZ17_12385 [Solibacillus sp. FSL R7-0682]|uniref:hypothetical protein n=1 Tax=Solibacillus sp. FSL R7-0682 TaxID=2921690 RepID=UPI0030FA90A9
MNITEFQTNIKLILAEIFHPDFSSAFNGPITFDDFCTQILFELYKDSYILRYQHKTPLQTHVQNEISSLLPNTAATIKNSTYQQKKRLMKLVKYYKDDTKKYFKNNGIDLNQINGLNIPELKTMEEKRNGHALTALNYDELNNIRTFKLFEYILKKTITKSKNVSNKDLIDAFTHLDDYYRDLNLAFKKEPSMDILIKIYDIENSYFTNLAYQIADYLEKNNVKDCDLTILSPLLVITDSSINFAASNRFMYHRHTYISELIQRKNYAHKNLAQIIYMKAVLTTKFKRQINALFLQLDEDDVKNHLFKNYDLTTIYSYKKECSQKKISIIRSLYKIYIRDVEYPKIRT